MTQTFVQAVSAAEAVSGKNAKLAAIAGLDRDGQKLVHEAQNPYRVFNVKKWPFPKTFADSDDSLDTFFKLLDALHNREVTGDAARLAVSDVLGCYTKRTAEYLQRVILKDLRCGLDTSSFNKVYPGLVPTFDVMLAGKVDEKYQWQFPCLAEVKYDGLRTIAICQRGEVKYFSRSGKTHEHLAGVFDAELRQLEQHLGFPVVVDGEVMGKTFQDTVIAKGEGASKDELVFWAFDYMSLDVWTNRRQIVDQGRRSHQLEQLLKQVGTKRILKSVYRVCHNRAEAKAFFDEVTKAGGEGLIIKDMKAPYVWDRDLAWAKWKPVLDVDLKITGFFEGQGRLKGTLGGITVEGQDENGKRIACECGSGFTDEDRAYFWANRSKLLGKTVQLEAQEISKAQGSDTYALRFPVYIRVRDDK